MGWSRTNKYGVSAREERTLDGVVYASKAEAYRASELQVLKDCALIDKWGRQRKVQLGPDFKTIVDFEVTGLVDGRIRRWFEEVKGYETWRFRMLRRLWPKYGPGKLVILKRRGNDWTKEVLEGASA
jgi:transposase